MTHNKSTPTSINGNEFAKSKGLVDTRFEFQKKQRKTNRRQQAGREDEQTKMCAHCNHEEMETRAGRAPKSAGHLVD